MSAGRIELENERIGGAAGKFHLGPGSNRKVEGSRDAGDVHAAFNVDGNGVSLVGAGTAQIGGIDQQRIDDQRLRFVVIANLEFHLIARNHISNVHILFDAVDGLISARLALKDGLAIGPENQVACRIQRPGAHA